MTLKHFLKPFTLMATSLLFLSACALSPQAVVVEPKPELPYQSLGMNQSVTVLVKDDRPEDHFGTRGGTYPETSVLTLGNDLPKAIYTAVTHGLHQQGFNAMNPGDTDHHLNIILEELRYTPAEGAVVNRVTVDATVRAEIYKGDTHLYTNAYKSQTLHNTVSTPSMKKNEEFITGELNRTLTRILSDEKLLLILRDGVVN
ncbi:MAG TPA: YajG family lipoprotein [Alcanivoracaceae bacterium]|nr:YajG family lipoprotein [Alcanivoracaceae bacterium]